MKKNLRERVLKELTSVPEAIFIEKNEAIFEQFKKWLPIQKGQTIAITISRNREVDTFRIIQFAWQNGLQVVVPKCRTKTKTMDFFLLSDFNQLEDSFMGLKEPDEKKTIFVTKEKIDLVVVPGVCFDKQGYRIGYGGGYYDRFLNNYQGITVSLCLDLQIVENLPKCNHDIPVQTIITESAIINI
mgnify:CR=1 FL=1